MDLFASQTPALIHRIRAGVRSTDLEPSAPVQQPTTQLIALATAQKPPGLDTLSGKVAAHYMGDSSALLYAQLAKHYPNSARVMPVAPIAYVRMWARSDAGGYDQPPARYLVDADAEALDETDPAAEAFADVLARSSIDVTAPEAERRALTPVRAVAVHASFVPAIDDEPPAYSLRVLWPREVVCLPHPALPGEERGLIFAAVRLASPSTEKQRWRVYRRIVRDDDDGQPVEWGPWEWATWVEGEGVEPTWREYDGNRLPLVFLRIEDPDAGFWPHPERDTLSLADTLNEQRSNLAHVVNLQGHSTPVISDDTFEEDKQLAGPEHPIRLRSNGSFQWATPAPALQEMREVIEESQRTVGAARGNNPNAYSARPGQAESGVARLVANLPHERRLRELRPRIKAFDERLCRMLMDMCDAFDDSVSLLFGDTYRPRTELAPTIQYEDPEGKQRRALVDVDLGVLSLAEYAADVGRYETAAAAAAAGIPDQPRAAATAGDVLRRDDERDDRDTRAPMASGQAEATINEVTLGIERLGRIGDVDGLNALRKKLAEILGVSLPDAQTDSLAQGAEETLEAAAELEPEDEAELDEATRAR